MGLFNMINSFFSPEDAYKAAEDESSKGWEQSQGYQRPYWQQGQNQYNNLMGAENSLLDPAALQNKWAQGYETSPYAKQMLEQSRNQGLDAASSMGLMGSSAATNNIQQTGSQIVNADRQQYMNDLMNKYMAGVGIGQNIYGIGANAGSNLGQGAMRQGENMAGLAYGRQAAPGALFGKLAGGAIDLGLNAYTGGLYGGAKGAWGGASGAMNNMMRGAYSG